MKQIIVWLFLAGILFVAGVGIGLGIAWGIMPVRLANTAPGTLQESDKDRYRVLIAEDYLVTGDLERSRARLGLLNADNSIPAIADQISRKAWKDEKEGTALNMLQIALNGSLGNQTQAATQVLTLVLETPFIVTTMPFLTTDQSPTLSPARTMTISNTTTTPPVFNILSRTPVCESDRYPPLLEINIIDPSGKPLNGVVIIVSSIEGSERIISGLKPERAAGTADFLIYEGIIYSLMFEGSSGSPELLTTAECTNVNGEPFPGGWKLQIQY